MAPTGRDPYAVLGVSPDASDAELRGAYRRLAQLHHPDHNGGSAEAAQRFEAVQEAYALALKLRASGSAGRRAAGGRAPGGRAPGGRAAGTGAARPSGVSPDIEARIAELERELRDARDAAARAARASAQAIRDARDALADGRGRASDEELGYVTTDDSFSKIIADAGAQLARLYSEAREEPVRERVADFLDDVAAKLKRDPPEQT
jgi:DnaJ domain